MKALAKDGSVSKEACKETIAAAYQTLLLEPVEDHAVLDHLESEYANSGDSRWQRDLPCDTTV